MSLSLLALGAFAEDLVIDGDTEPGVLDLTGDASLVIDLSDPQLDLAAFVVETPEGDILLDELFAAAKKDVVSNDLGPANIQKKHVANIKFGEKASVCVEVLGVRVCVPG